MIYCHVLGLELLQTHRRPCLCPKILNYQQLHAWKLVIEEFWKNGSFKDAVVMCYQDFRRKPTHTSLNMSSRKKEHIAKRGYCLKMSNIVELKRPYDQGATMI